MALSALYSIPTFDYFAGQLGMAAGTPSLTSEVFREASQSQNVSQNSRAFGGATAANTMTDTAEISQEASAQNSKDATIDAATGSGGEGGRIAQVVIGGGQLAQIADVLAQNQGGSQMATANLQDAQGNPSEAANALTQSEEIGTALNALNELNVNMPINFMGDFPSLTQVTQGLGTVHPPLNMDLPDMSIAPPATEDETSASEAEDDDGGGTGASADADDGEEEGEHVLNVVFPSLSVFLKKFEDSGVNTGSPGLTTAGSGAGTSSPYQYHASIWPINFVT